MTNLLNFVINHYVLFMLISIFLILSLIGYFVDVKRSKNNPYKIEKKEENINLDQLKGQENVTLQSVLDKNKTANVNDPNQNNPNVV